MATDGDERAFVAVAGSIHFAQHAFRILPPVIPLLALSLPYPLWQLGALVSAYFVGSGLGQAPLGVLADRYDRRFVLAPSVALMGAGYLLVGAAPALAPPGSAAVAGTTLDGTYLLLAAGALVAGVGASAIHPVGYPLITANVRPGVKGRALGAWGSAGKLGDAAAPMAVAALVLAVDWPAVFGVFGFVGLGYAAVLFAILSGDRFETRPARADGGDRRAYAYPMLVMLGFFAARSVAQRGVTAFLPALLVSAYGYALGGIRLPAASLANLYFTGAFLIAAATQLVTGWLVDRRDPRVVVLGLATTSAGALLLLAGGGLSPAALVAVLVLLGATFWNWSPARDALIGDIAPPDREGRTFGYLMAASHLLGAASPAVIGFVGDRAGLTAGFGLLAGVTLLSGLVVAALFSPRIYRRSGEELVPE